MVPALGSPLGNTGIVVADTSEAAYSEEEEAAVGTDCSSAVD